MMAFGSVSNSKLHCCLVILILFILVFLSLPLLLIYLANTRFEETWMRQNATLENNGTCPSSGPDGAVQCSDGSFPCPSCPGICIQQHRMCDGVTDCPDHWDESVGICFDSNGVVGDFFKRLLKNRQNPTSGHKESMARPESCDQDAFVQDECKCNLSEPFVVICEGFGLRAIPTDLSSSVFKIRMSNNSINSLDGVVWPPSLTSLVLLHNEITEIGRGAFATAPKLLRLYLAGNRISRLDDDALESVNKLVRLQLELNRLTNFSTRLLRHTPAISQINLSDNQIELPEDTEFSISVELKELLLDHNRITAIKRKYFSRMSRLNWLSLTHNQIGFIEPDSFEGDVELQELNLSFNKLTVIHRRIFANKLNIQRLYLSGNPIGTGGLPEDAFREVVGLKSLNLTQIEFTDLKRETFADLRHLEFIYFEKFRYCHYAARVRVCRPLTDGLSSIEELLAFPILKYAVWIVALVCSLGNVFVFVWRSVSPHEDHTLSLFIKNLSIADLMMGAYLSTIGWQDWKFQNNFRDNAIDWMGSWKCSAIGFLAILSSELSVFILTIITIERYRSIMSIRRLEAEAQRKRARLFVALAWLASFLLAFYPLYQWLNRKSDFYATNGLCLPLHIDQPFTHGWQYSAFVYLGVNFLAVLVIMALYARMYTMIVDGRQSARPALFKAEKREDTILAIRFFFIVVTDCMCWIPIVAIKIMALLKVSISASIYGWLVVFIIPINSALNPIVYTLAAPTTLRAAICRLFERLFFAFDRLTGGIYDNGCSTSNLGQIGAAPGAAAATGANGHASRRRHKMGSNSTTTCDTFDTSITSNSKVSFDSTLLAQHDQPAAPEMANYVVVVGQRRQFNSIPVGGAGAGAGEKPPASGLTESKESSFSSTASSSPVKTNAKSDRRQAVQRYARLGAAKFGCITSYKGNAVRHRVLSAREGEIASELGPLAGEWQKQSEREANNKSGQHVDAANRWTQLDGGGGPNQASEKCKLVPILIDYDGLSAQIGRQSVSKSDRGGQSESAFKASDDLLKSDPTAAAATTTTTTTTTTTRAVERKPDRSARSSSVHFETDQ